MLLREDNFFGTGWCTKKRIRSSPLFQLKTANGEFVVTVVYMVRKMQCAEWFYLRKNCPVFRLLGSGSAVLPRKEVASHNRSWLDGCLTDFLFIPPKLGDDTIFFGKHIFRVGDSQLDEAQQMYVSLHTTRLPDGKSGSCYLLEGRFVWWKNIVYGIC